MSLYFYCPKASEGALKLINLLGATRLRRFDGMDFWNKWGRIKLDVGSHLVCWGDSLGGFDEIKVLNSCEHLSNKYKQYQILSKIVPTIATTVPYPGYTVKHYLESNYIPRRFNHKILPQTSENPDYFIQRNTFISEYKVHSFEGRSIRAGVKVPIDGYKVVGEDMWRPNSNLLHPWVKTLEGGWRTNYEGFHSTPEIRAIAHLAIKTLGLQFGAVSIGQARYGGLMVIGVDTGPFIEGKSVDSYARAINRWIEGKPEKLHPKEVEF